jgi:hypothetical protein
VTNWPQMSFILVPQTDRRQTVDRRRFHRSGRRASDAAAYEQPLSADAGAAVWNISENDQPSSREKHYLH